MRSIKHLHFFEISIMILQIIILFLFGTIQLSDAFRECIKSLMIELFKIQIVGISENVAGIFIQVDAAILTLTIALVAFMSSVVSESYMGISISDYYLNLRPLIYNQLITIIISLLQFLASSLCFIIKCYYLVTAFLFCEVLLVMMSAFAVYGIFSGKESVKDEIFDYSISTQTNNKVKIRENVKEKKEKNNKDEKK